MFKSSVALENSKNSKYIPRSHTEGLMQAIADKFDIDISSQNGKMQTHSLALIMTQLCNGNETSDEETFVTLKKTKIKDSSLLNTILQHYTGPKKPKMPPDIVPQKIHTAMFIEVQAAIKKISQELDLEFLKDIATKHETPEYPCYNTKGTTENGVSCGNKTKAMYTPLINL